MTQLQQDVTTLINAARVRIAHVDKILKDQGLDSDRVNWRIGQLEEEIDDLAKLLNEVLTGVEYK